LKQNFHKAGTLVNVCPRCLRSTAKHPAELGRWDGCEKSRENNPIKMNVCETNQPLADFLFFYFFHQKSLPSTVYILTPKRKGSLYPVFLHWKQVKANSVDFLQFLRLFIFHSKLRVGIFFLCCIHRCMQSLTAILKSVMKGEV